MKPLLGMIFAAVIVAPSLAQNGQVKLSTQGAPSLRILSVPVSLDREKRKVSLSLELENTGDKPIKGFGWVYRTRDVIRGYNVSITADMPDVSVVLAPGEKKTVVLLVDAQVPESILNMPVGEITISSVTFEDGSSWKRNKENLLLIGDATEQIVGRERRARVSQVAWCGGGCFDSRRRVNSTVMRFTVIPSCQIKEMSTP